MKLAINTFKRHATGWILWSGLSVVLLLAVSVVSDSSKKNVLSGVLIYSASATYEAGAFSEVDAKSTAPSTSLPCAKGFMLVADNFKYCFQEQGTRFEVTCGDGKSKPRIRGLSDYANAEDFLRTYVSVSDLQNGKLTYYEYRSNPYIEQPMCPGGATCKGGMFMQDTSGQVHCTPTFGWPPNVPTSCSGAIVGGICYSCPSGSVFDSKTNTCSSPCTSPDVRSGLYSNKCLHCSSGTLNNGASSNKCN